MCRNCAGIPPPDGHPRRLESVVHSRGDPPSLATSTEGRSRLVVLPGNLRGNLGGPSDLAERRAMSSVDVNRPGPGDDSASQNMMRSCTTRTMWCRSPFHVSRKTQIARQRLPLRLVWADLDFTRPGRDRRHIGEVDGPSRSAEGAGEFAPVVTNSILPKRKTACS